MQPCRRRRRRTGHGRSVDFILQPSHMPDPFIYMLRYSRRRTVVWLTRLFACSLSLFVPSVFSLIDPFIHRSSVMSDVEEDLVTKKLKIVLVGDSGSGKTSIAQKFCNNEFTRQYTPTSGIDFFLKNVSVGYYKNVDLHLWDVGGLALHGNMLDKYVFDAHIILLVYDVTNSFSFEVLEEWIDKIRKLNENYEETPLMAVVGNKCDMEHQRSVKRDRTHKFAADNGFPTHDVSARTGEAVSLCIVTLAAQILGVRLTKTDQDYHKPIIIAEIGDTVDMNMIHKVVKRIPAKRQTQIPFYPHLPGSKSTVCLLQ